ncbi:hypothetical protein CEXT_460251 [Caerostris extrusa]|uniref:Uncharacterized protein n=1 Tax=Caerostris extrusa TaxID=172846 RepID=A0AAV4WD29_CAEEX|nr:hypothetical protein CEXT_460251 [Caerostris extrusa]
MSRGHLATTRSPFMTPRQWVARSSNAKFCCVQKWQQVFKKKKSSSSAVVDTKRFPRSGFHHCLSFRNSDGLSLVRRFMSAMKLSP